MNTTYKYSILQYVHSQILGETLNVGVLFIFPDHGKIEFYFPRTFNRIRHLYNSFEEWQLKSHLTGLKNKVNRIDHEINTQFDFSSEGLSRLVATDILTPDATALQFSNIYTGITDEIPLEEIVKNQYSVLFENYNEVLDLREKKDEAYIIKSFKSTLFSDKENQRIEKYLKKNKVVKSDKTSLTFEIGWKNTTLNLIKPVGLDLLENYSINTKAITLFAQLNFLKEVAEEEKIRFDLFPSKPTDSKLFKAYDKALEILELIQANAEIWEEHQVRGYTETLINELETDEA